MPGEKQQKGQDGVVDVGHQHQHKHLVVPETEADDLRELHLSATFLTPYSVTPTEDNNVWLSNTQQAYIDHMKQGARKQVYPSHAVRTIILLYPVVVSPLFTKSLQNPERQQLHTWYIVLVAAPHQVLYVQVRTTRHRTRSCSYSANKFVRHEYVSSLRSNT